MAGKKRSETNPQGTTGHTAVIGTHIEREKARMGSGQVVSAFCLLCGHSIPENRVTDRVEGKDIALETTPYFDSIEWREDQPFGMSRAAAGKKSFADWHYIEPEDAPEFFEAYRLNLIRAVRLAIKRGWIKREELK
jgi:hypothetical protein